jgi:long-subunit acyl-CoA synthetase (AMP-forming)
MSGYSNLVYATWREDLDAEPGYTRELISCDTQALLDRGATLDDLYVEDVKGVDTLTKYFKRIAERIPNSDMLGTRKGDIFEWITYKEAYEMSESLAHAMLDKGLESSFEAEERMWNFVGIIGNNRQEWFLTQAANMMALNTTIPLYESLGVDAMKFVVE